MARNLLAKTKENLRNETTHTWEANRQDCAISFGRLGDWLPELCKRKFGLSGRQGWLPDFHNAQSKLAAKIVQCAIPAGTDYRLRDCIAQFSWPTVTIPQKCTKLAWRKVLGRNEHF